MDQKVNQKVDQFFSNYPVKSVPSGQVILQAGDQPQLVYHLIQGRVKQYDLSEQGTEVIVNVFKPPAFFPMSYVINDAPNEYYFETEIETQMHQAPAAEVLDFLKANPDVLYDLLARVYRGTDGLLRRVAHLMSSSARSRLAYELLVECRRFNESSESGISVNLSEADIASKAGLTRETVSRELQKLKAEGLVTSNKRQIVVPSADRLEQALKKGL